LFFHLNDISLRPLKELAWKMLINSKKRIENGCGIEKINTFAVHFKSLI
jgi:hypothetical protein